MKIVRETTQWKGKTPNHIYVLDDSMNSIIAYVPLGSKKVTKFSKPIKWDRSERTFEVMQDAKPEPRTITVEGSTGNKYYLTEQDSVWSCTCPGFTYRGKCKHITDNVPLA